MAHSLHVLPDRAGSAAENMAHDFLMLQGYRPAEAIRLRHYDWSRPAYTFGMSQKIAYVLSEIGGDESVDLCRRPTGGGVVSHLDDWTYALVIPLSHPLAAGQPIETYRAVHETIATSMQRQGVEAVLNDAAPEDNAPAVCFNKPELYDVLLKNLPTKVAGAAQKRTKAGYLIQGSLWRAPLSHLNWDRFYTDFILELASLAEAEISYPDWPSWNLENERQIVQKFDSDEWNRRR